MIEYAFSVGDRCIITCLDVWVNYLLYLLVFSVVQTFSVKFFAALDGTCPYEIDSPDCFRLCVQ